MLGFGKRYPLEGFPKGFKPQHIGVRAAMKVADIPSAEIAAYFRSHHETADALLAESYDKRYSPSTFIEEAGGGFNVGWYGKGYECVQLHSNLADAATDYLLFSLGKGRWKSTD